MSYLNDLKTLQAIKSQESERLVELTTISDGYTVPSSSNNKTLMFESSSNGYVTLPDYSEDSIPIGFTLKVIQVGSWSAIFEPSGSSTIKSLNGAVETIGEGSMVDVIKISTNGWLISGDIQ